MRRKARPTRSLELVCYHRIDWHVHLWFSRFCRVRRRVRRDCRETRAEPWPGAIWAGAHMVLITGATGFIGRRLTQALVAAGDDVIVLTRDETKASLFSPPYHIVVRTLISWRRRRRLTRLSIWLVSRSPTAPGPKVLKRIIASRVGVTQAIVRLIDRLECCPSALVNGLAVGRARSGRPS